MEISLHLKHQSKQFGVFLEFIRGQAPRICQRQIQHRYINTSSLKNADVSKGSKMETAALVGKSLAEKASGVGIQEVKFDRNGFLFHGRVKAFADAAREAGLKF